MRREPPLGATGRWWKCDRCGELMLVWECRSHYAQHAKKNEPVRILPTNEPTKPICQTRPR